MPCLKAYQLCAVVESIYFDRPITDIKKLQLDVFYSYMLTFLCHDELATRVNFTTCDSILSFFLQEKVESSDEWLPELPDNPNRKKTCRICRKNITNLNRHLRDVHNINVPKPRKDLVVSELGYIKRICPLCSRSLERMRDHLARTHKITEKGSLNRMMKKAKPVRKYQEVGWSF